MEILGLFEKFIWFGFAAMGFAILFNVPVRTLFQVWLLGAFGGLTKIILMHFGVGVVLSTFSGATLIGLLTIAAAHSKHAPPLVFSIPAVIPMVPGAFAYRMMIGLIRLAGDSSSAGYQQILSDTFSNGLKVMFILMALAVGVALPMLITRKKSVKEITLRKRTGFDD